MKQLFIGVFLLFSINILAQTQFKNMCLEKACASEISKLAGASNLLKVDDMESNYLINVYDAGENNELQLWYTDGTKELKRIVAPYNLIIKIYQDYFGRVADTDKIKADRRDIWKSVFNNSNYELRISKMERDDYWRLDIFKR